ncbi:hypothetical protein IQ241_09135 [Romeria aff. gracilis LEGE 07310]|uniref:Uncharacterized protein n=2 Tax=Vasconcelosia TaxID=3366328 RepID=A0A8J7ADF2_9CYAN|nr:hypothetical protein [Romeria aff. gracilis LEGE 07310]
MPIGAQTTDSEELPDLEEEVIGTPSEAVSLPEDSRFECQLNNREFTVMYLPESQPDQAYPWAQPGEMGGGWTAERRCYEISDRLERYRPEGLLDLRTGMENGYDIVCVTTEENPNSCQIVFTVPQGQNPVVTRDRVFENLTLADSGTDTTSVNTFTGNGSELLSQIGQVLGGLPLPGNRPQSRSNGINLKPYLDAADGGTGEYLRRPAAQPGQRLNPDSFR